MTARESSLGRRQAKGVARPPPADETKQRRKLSAFPQPAAMPTSSPCFRHTGFREGAAVIGSRDNLCQGVVALDVGRRRRSDGRPNLPPRGSCRSGGRLSRTRRHCAGSVLAAACVADFAPSPSTDRQQARPPRVRSAPTSPAAPSRGQCLRGSRPFVNPLAEPRRAPVVLGGGRAAGELPNTETTARASTPRTLRTRTSTTPRTYHPIRRPPCRPPTSVTSQ